MTTQECEHGCPVCDKHRLWTKPDVMTYYRVSRAMVDKWIRNDELIRTWLGKAHSVRFTTDDVLALTSREEKEVANG